MMQLKWKNPKNYINYAALSKLEIINDANHVLMPNIHGQILNYQRL